MDGSRWTACRQQLEAALRAMPGHVEFVVVLFSSRLTEPPGQTGWMRAESGAVERVLGGGRTSIRAAEWIPGRRSIGSFPSRTPPDVITASPPRAAHWIASRKGIGTAVTRAARRTEPLVRETETLPAEAWGVSVGLDRTTVPMEEVRPVERSAK